jgi:uncharacterized SAM-binding protein YcdF (DUF218 family)
MTVSTDPPTTGPTAAAGPAAAPRRGRARRVVAWLVVAVVAVLVLIPAAAAWQVMSSAKADDTARTDVVVVLGASQFWGRPSPVLESRLARGRSLLDRDVAARIVTVGGKQPGDRTTEAEAGRAWLTSHGVAGSSVVAVPEGRDTLESLQAVAALMQDKGWTSATIVTDPAHEARSLAMARALGIDAHAAPTQSGAGSAVTLDYVARESAGLAWFWVVQRRDVAQVVPTP